MSLIKRPNSRYYLFQIQGRKYFGSTQTPKKALAVKVEAKVREDAVSRLVLGEVKPIRWRTRWNVISAPRKAHRITRTLSAM